MLDRARRLTADQVLPNVTHLHADAQVHPFAPARCDLCISRFGTMFFTDPVAAFTTIGRALRRGARLVLLVWQERDRNEWATLIRRALTSASAAPGGPDPFSLADPTVTDGILTNAGFTEVGFTDVHEPVYYGPDSATASDAVLRLLKFNDLLADVDAATADQARARLRATLDAHHTGGGVPAARWRGPGRSRPPRRRRAACSPVLRYDGHCAHGRSAGTVIARPDPSPSPPATSTPEVGTPRLISTPPPASIPSTGAP